MPHAIENAPSEEAGVDNTLQQLLYGGGIPDSTRWDNEEKSENAQDFEDISDDDLPEEEEATNNVANDAEADDFLQQLMRGSPEQATTNGDASSTHVHYAQPDGDIFGDSEEYNELFGERLISSPVEEQSLDSRPEPAPQRTGGLMLPSKSGLALPRPAARPAAVGQQKSSKGESSPDLTVGPPSLENGVYSPEAYEDELDDVEDPTLRAQMQLFRISKLRMQGEDVDWDPVKTQDDHEFWQQFSNWEDDEVPRFCELLPPVPGVHRGKIPLKPPKALQPTKISLDLMPDQEKTFKTATIASKPAHVSYLGRNIVSLEDQAAASDDSSDDMAFDEVDQREAIGGVTMQDLAFICQDWDILSMDSTSLAGEQPESGMPLDNQMDDVETARPAKRQRTSYWDTRGSVPLDAPFMRFDDPERAAAKVAQTVMLDMNDPYLLLDEHAPQTKRKARRAPGDNSRDAALGRDLARRYNISNDDAYDLLKENHQHKIRSTLGAMAIEHSMPATKLQWPFYKVTLDSKEKRSFHRQYLNLYEPPGRVYKALRPRFHKKKHVRGREAKDLFAKAEDLSFADNSNVLLLEYSEEVPTALSNFGMGNRLINYYRKRNADDQERPKREIGEAHVLLNQDKSPFANFGHVDAGETVPTIQNGMYRAPIFQHESRSTDFVVALSHTHENGNRMYLRNVENLHIVGQQLPVAEVPGEHSRRVTDAAKKRLRAISYRIYGKTLDPARRGVALTNKVLMRHIPGSDVPQTRSKMREFMKYEKKAKNSEDDGYWVPVTGQAVPDAETIRAWIRPEDVCLLDAMQVGVQHLNDLGISTGKNEEENEEEELEEGAHIERQLAPWQTSKNFIAATQGKAMLALHGEGDPTGRGEAFSFIRTSMKGGYVAEGESVEEKLSDRKRKEQGGHKYNVATQQAKYDSNIRLIWNRQKAALANDVEMSDTELEDDDAPGEQDGGVAYGIGATPRTSFSTPAAGFDDSVSQFSKQSAERGDEVLIIKRKQRDAYGSWMETPVRIDNSKVIKLYRRRKQEIRLAKLRFAIPRCKKAPNNGGEIADFEHSHTQLKPTGDAEMDALAQQELKKELARLERNKDRRVAREKLKGRMAAATTGGPGGTTAGAAGSGSPSGPVGTDGGSEIDGPTGDSTTTTPQKTGKGRSKDGTARKCANCGQVGHIKTNRKWVSNSSSPGVAFCACSNPPLVAIGSTEGSPMGRSEKEQKSVAFAAGTEGYGGEGDNVGSGSVAEAGAFATGALSF